MRQWRCALSFYSTCTILQVPSTVRTVLLSFPKSGFFLRSEVHARSTKDRKKGCAYDPGAFNKQGSA